MVREVHEVRLFADEAREAARLVRVRMASGATDPI
ncbi:hypothetical protein SAMN05216561_10643 [Nocardioides psychrotolerans]|uniref:Uncharacterized protein n=1 Tax=Nocardioides psychrotolerans TaxID=1005945 RepID=A0A1I3GAL7_9ACTN|nr:hypothetical protein SAMN05216561_10643 [Nocardioides psychrotolerans]